VSEELGVRLPNGAVATNVYEAYAEGYGEGHRKAAPVPQDEGERAHPFAELCDMLPESTNWGDALTPDIARHIAQVALASNKAAAVAGPAVPPIVRDVLEEIERAVAKFPTWPTDPLHAFAVLGEEVGELQKAILQCTYEPHKSTRDDVRTEAIQAAAMALRFLLSLDRYEYWRAVQHEQEQS